MRSIPIAFPIALLRQVLAVVLLLAVTACATDRAPAGYKAYCEKWPDRQECGGKGATAPDRGQFALREGWYYDGCNWSNGRQMTLRDCNVNLEELGLFEGPVK